MEALLPQLILALGGNAMAAISSWALPLCEQMDKLPKPGGEKCSGLRLDEAVYWLLWNVGDYHSVTFSFIRCLKLLEHSSLLARLMRSHRHLQPCALLLTPTAADLLSTQLVSSLGLGQDWD